MTKKGRRRIRRKERGQTEEVKVEEGDGREGDREEEQEETGRGKDLREL